MTSPMRGQRYGGSSRTNDDGIPFRTVLDKRRDIRSVITIPSTITAVSMSAEMTDELPPKEKNIVIIAISVGKRPLQGTKQFVNMAMRRSRGESMMRQPVTPQALQPKPIIIVRHCLPHACARRNALSILNAMRGR